MTTSGLYDKLLSAQQRVLFSKLLRARRLKTTNEAPILPRADRSLAPLSFAQQRIWYLNQLEPESAFYNTPVVLRLTGDLDERAVVRAMAEIVARHDVLRSCFPIVDDEPCQRIAADQTLNYERYDFPHLSTTTRESEAWKFVDTAVREPFDIVNGPMVRVRVLGLAPDEHWLLFLTHHLVFDGWSVHLLAQEFFGLYSCFSKGRPSPLAPLALQYGDFAAWQREWCQGEVLQRSLDYWVSRMAGAPPLLELPTDRPRPAVQRYSGRTHAFRFSATLTEQVEAFSRANDTTPFALLVAALDLVLWRYTGQTDIVLSTGIANRTRGEFESLIGCFINILLLRTDLSGAPSALTLVQRVKETIIEAFDHQDLPFEKLVTALRPKRDPSYSPLAQVMIVFHNAALAIPELENIKIDLLMADKAIAQYDLLVFFRMESGVLHGLAEYNTDLFDEVRVARMMAHLENILSDILRHPTRSIPDLKLLGPAEEAEIATTFNATEAPFPDGCLHDQFERRVRHNADAVALRSGDTVLSYGDLNARAERLAHILSGHGVRPGTPVGVALTRRADLVVGMMAIAKSGGAYLPLDPSYPSARLAFMLSDAQVPLLLTQGDLLAKLDQAHGATVVDMDQLDLTNGSIDVADERVSTTPTDPAYVIYTSGSTGQPKGVTLDHRGRVSNFHDFNIRFDIGANDRLLALSSMSFDMCAYDVFGTLAAGGTIVMVEDADVRDPEAWARLIGRHGVTIWHSAPALLELLVSYVEDHPEFDLSSLRLVLLGGDWIPLTLPDRIKALAAGARVVSLGGATEVSMDSTIYEVESIDPTWRSIPYGRPMANQRCYVLDDNRNLTPIGVPGELHIGGIGVGKGYLNRPELTAERFIADPFAEASGARMYRTGDLAVWREDGNLELLGRLDTQIKIHGLRVELGEIAAALKKQPDVKDALVVLRQDPVAAPRLVAYIISESGAVPAVEGLRSALSKTLPTYMVPSHVVGLDAFPLSPNGKVDRRALPSPDHEAFVRDRVAVPPAGPLELQYLKVWQRLLGRDDFGVTDDFFDLGGDSYQAIRLVKDLPGSVTVLDLFRDPTIRRLAARLDDQPEDTMLLFPILQPDGPIAATVVCVPYAGGSAIVYRHLAKSLAPGCAVFALSLPGHEANREMEELQSIDQVATVVIDEIRATVSGPIILYGHCAGTALTVELAKRLERDGHDLRMVFIGAAMPISNGVGINLDDDAAVLGLISALGAIEEAEDPERLRYLTRSFAHDSRCASAYVAAAISATPTRIAAPLICILGEVDPVTAGQEEKAWQWRALSDTVDVVILPGAGHYFIKHQAIEVARIINQRADWTLAAIDMAEIL